MSVRATRPGTARSAAMQSFAQRLVGWFILIADTLQQRRLNRRSGDHAVFNSTEEAAALPSPDARRLHGLTAVVTGANVGIGLETARWLCAAGVHVVLACRSLDKAEVAADDIRRTIAGARVSTMRLDLSDLNSVRAFATEFASSEADTNMTNSDAVDVKGTVRPLHMLILNAGVLGVQHANPETHFMVNHLAHALLALLLVPSLARGAATRSHARIVTVSSLTYRVSNLDLDDIAYQRRKYDSFQAYANSKLCNIQFMRALQARLQDTAIRCFSVHPGESTSEVARHFSAFSYWFHKNVMRWILLTPREAARSSVFAAAADDALNADGTVIHAGTKYLNVPRTLIADADCEALWKLSLNVAHVSTSEVDAAVSAGLCREPLYPAVNERIHAKLS